MKVYRIWKIIQKNKKPVFLIQHIEFFYTGKNELAENTNEYLLKRKFAIATKMFVRATKKLIQLLKIIKNQQKKNYLI